MEELFKAHINDSIYNSTLNRKVKGKQKKYKDIGDVVLYVRPLIYQKYMHHKKLKDLYQAHEFNGFWILKNLSFKGEDGDVLVILDSVTGDIKVIAHIDIINQLE